jgi:hypothetical protein
MFFPESFYYAYGILLKPSSGTVTIKRLEISFNIKLLYKWFRLEKQIYIIRIMANLLAGNLF